MSVCFVLAWDSGVWVATHDVRKIFDPIEHGSLFQALQPQKVPDTYLQVLRWLHADQSGNVGGNRFFCNITRGVKQIDVFCPMLCNSGLPCQIGNNF